jgi:pimeloyl-ACP methyl ester carboxylesterase
MNMPRFLAPIVKALDAFMLRFFKRWYLKFSSDQAGMNEDSRKITFQMFLKAADAIPHLRYHLVNYDFTEFIAKSRIPYILIQCEYDKGINSMLSTTLKAIHANELAEVVELKGVGHIANLDNPQAFNTFLMEILSKLSCKE